MNKSEQKAFFETFTNKMQEIMLSKGDDYANDTDRLSNFKLVGDLAKVSTEKGVHIQIANKIVRLGELLSGKTPKHESISDSLIDIANYVVLLAMVVSEKQIKPVKSLSEHIKEFLVNTENINIDDR